MTTSNSEIPVQTKKRTPLIAILAIAVIFAAGLFWRSRTSGTSGAPEGPPRSTMRTVKAFPLQTGTIVEQLEVTGTLRANQALDLNPKISGRVGAVYVKEGDRVRRGQVLVQLDDADLRQAVTAAQANLRSAQVALEQTRVGLPARVAQVNTNIDNARATLNTARARYQQALLNEPSAITQARSQVEVASEGVKAAQASLNQARTTATQTQQQNTANIKAAEAGLAGSQAQLEQVRNGSRLQQVAQAQAQVNIAEAQVRDAQTNLTRQNILFQGGATARANVDAAQTNLEVAQAQLESARQNLSLVKEGARTEEVRAAEEVVRQREADLAQARAGAGDILRAQSAVTSALAAFAQAQQQLRQATSNLSQIPITRQETRTALEAVRQAESGLRQALANRTQIPVAQADVPAAQARVAQAQSQLDQANLNLGYARITSPINGVVNTKQTDVGESAAPGTTLFNLVALDTVYFEAQVPETQLARIKVGQPIRVYITAVSSEPLVGYVSDIIPVASEQLRQFRIRVTLPNRDLTPGAFARGTLQTQVITNTLTVPTEVIKTQDRQTFLLVAKPQPEAAAPAAPADSAAPTAGGAPAGAPASGGQRGGSGRSGGGGEGGGGGPTAVIEKRMVRVGASAAGKSQVIGNLTVGELIVASGGTFAAGDKVRISLEP